MSSAMTSSAIISGSSRLAPTRDVGVTPSRPRAIGDLCLDVASPVRQVHCLVCIVQLLRSALDVRRERLERLVRIRIRAPGPRRTFVEPSLQEGTANYGFETLNDAPKKRDCLLEMIDID